MFNYLVDQRTKALYDDLKAYECFLAETWDAKKVETYKEMDIYDYEDDKHRKVSRPKVLTYILLYITMTKKELGYCSDSPEHDFRKLLNRLFDVTIVIDRSPKLHTDPLSGIQYYARPASPTPPRPYENVYEMNKAIKSIAERIDKAKRIMENVKSSDDLKQAVDVLFQLREAYKKAPLEISRAAEYNPITPEDGPIYYSSVVDLLIESIEQLRNNHLKSLNHAVSSVDRG